MNKGRDDKSTGAQRWAQAKEWLRLRSRRWLYRFHIAASSTIAMTPATYLAVATALGVALVVTTMYSTSYAVTVDGKYIGRVAEQSTVEQAIQTVERQGTRMLGTEFQVEGDVDYQFALTLKSDLNTQGDMEDYFYDQLDEVSSALRMYEVTVDGQSVGIVKDETNLNNLLYEMKAQYTNENTTSVEFVEEVQVHAVYEADTVYTISEMRERLEENSTGDTTYTVVSGDTFNAIAHANDMAVSELKALNPGVNINRLRIGDVLNVKEYIPKLSVRTVEDVTYHQAIPCPVVEVEDSKMYKGDSKILVQGEEGDALVSATVTYINGHEKEREIHSTTTLKEPPPPPRPSAPRRSPRRPPRATTSGPPADALPPTSAAETSSAATPTTAASTSRCPTASLSRPPTAVLSPLPAGREPTASWSSLSTTTAPRPITPITPPCWFPPATRSIRARSSQRAAPPAAPPATTVTLRCA